MAEELKGKRINAYDIGKILGVSRATVRPWRDGTSRTSESIVRSGLVAPSGAAPGPAGGTTSALPHR
ncbi:MAG: hypothetical protein QOH21_1601 [Acidobacteriota bacterium]|jgi:hypothetical protein|nr:hypothetical protein [Acidobacteriota bacterium]